MNNFSYHEYQTIIESIQKYIPIISFDKINHHTEKYCVIRHDVEFSVQRALELAKFENSIGISSTYVFQVCNNNYNPFSHKNREQVLEIVKLGHDIGVHVHLGNFDKEKENVNYYIIKQAHQLSNALDYPINRFSIHRPYKEHLEHIIRIPGFINMSDSLYFTYTDTYTVYDLPVLYLADSNHEWKYGHPLDIDFSKISKMQLNCHPFSWTEKGLDNWNNFLILTKEKQLEALQSINEEIKTYPVDLYEKERDLVACD
jgi:hypothetical protein